MPIIDGFTSLLLTMIEAAKGYFSVKVTLFNDQLRKISMGDEGGLKQSIGFVFDEEEEEEEDEEDDIL